LASLTSLIDKEKIATKKTAIETIFTNKREKSATQLLQAQYPAGGICETKVTSSLCDTLSLTTQGHFFKQKQIMQ